MTQQYCNIKTLSECTGIKKSTLYNWVHEKKIPHYKVYGRLLFKLEEMIEFIESKRIEATDYESEARKMIGSSMGFRNNSGRDSGRVTSEKRREHV